MEQQPHPLTKTCALFGYDPFGSDPTVEQATKVLLALAFAQDAVDHDQSGMGNKLSAERRLFMLEQALCMMLLAHTNAKMDIPDDNISRVDAAFLIFGWTRDEFIENMETVLNEYAHASIGDAAKRASMKGN